jgi:hypothetical protein
MVMRSPRVFITRPQTFTPRSASSFPRRRLSSRDSLQSTWKREAFIARRQTFTTRWESSFRRRGTLARGSMQSTCGSRVFIAGSQANRIRPRSSSSHRRTLPRGLRESILEPANSFTAFHDCPPRPLGSVSEPAMSLRRARASFSQPITTRPGSIASLRSSETRITRPFRSFRGLLSGGLRGRDARRDPRRTAARGFCGRESQPSPIPARQQPRAPEPRRSGFVTKRQGCAA